MQPRLTRSQNESIIAGVCGGIGEYFGIDPVIVRLIFVLVTLTTGVGVLVYPVLWIVMPKAPASTKRVAGTQTKSFQQNTGVVTGRTVMREPVAANQARSGSTPAYGEAVPPESYKFDPWTGAPIEPPATGATTQLPNDPTAIPQYEPMTQVAPANQSRRRSWPVLGVVLVGIGIIALADAFNFPTEIVFPLLMIGAGLFLLLRRK